MATSVDTDLIGVPADPPDPAVTLAEWWAVPVRRHALSVQPYV
ncbi:hypothetical protein [Streptomyces sp900116325]|uniref:Uncharacterized protein n=1 Tax=Streptomyces sp. 900116325 TaxID=3154295 RepID=A0ABV2UBH2_9ACTN